MKFGVFDHLDRGQVNLTDHFENRLKLAEIYDAHDFHAYHIAEHHGTLRTMFQYKRALEAAGDDLARVDESRFCYPGPRPQSRA